MGLGHDQLMLINRQVAGGRVFIADFSQGKPVQQKYWEEWGESGVLDGWLDPLDLQLVGDFMGLGHDQLMLINRQVAGGRVFIADFSQGKPVQQKYWEEWGESGVLNGWFDPQDRRITGSFMGSSNCQLMLINRPQGTETP
jgi:hypothetical protein